MNNGKIEQGVKERKQTLRGRVQKFQSCALEKKKKQTNKMENAKIVKGGKKEVGERHQGRKEKKRQRRIVDQNPSSASSSTPLQNSSRSS